MPEPDLERPVFIVGAASSGTTLLGVMLDRHSQFACGPELYVFDKAHIYGRYETVQRRLGKWLRGGLLSDGQIDTPNFFHSREAYYCDHEMLTALARQSADLRGLFDAFFRNYLQRREKPRWVEKTGSNGYHLEQILGLYPQARIVHIVRDGRDAICSLMRRDGRPYHVVSHWLYNVSAALAWRGHPAYLEVKYETLVAEPEAALRRVCRHLDVCFEPGMLAPPRDGYWQKCAPGSIHATWNASPLAGGTSTRSVGRYRSDLAADVEALFWRMRLTPWARRKLRARHVGVTDLMHTLGYADGPLARLPPVRPRLCRQGVRQYLGRFRENWRRNHGVWLPLTYVWPLALTRGSSVQTAGRRGGLTCAESPG